MKLCGSGNVLKHLLHSSILHFIKVLFATFQDAVFVGFIVFKAIFYFNSSIILFWQKILKLVLIANPLTYIQFNRD
jgi:hypothetical protein